MREIPLDKGQVALVDDWNFDRLNQFKWYADWSEQSKTYYARCRGSADRLTGKRKHIRMHREILGIENPRVFVDHRDHNGLHNLEVNIRICTNQQNMQNCQSYVGSSLYKGVSWKEDQGRWRAYLCNQHLGNFARELDAALAYDRAALEKFGEFACLNFGATL